MRSLCRNALVMVLGIGMVGCEWQGGSGADGSGSTGAANFSGTYKASGGGFIVSVPTTGGSNSTLSAVQTIGTGGSGARYFQGTLSHTPVVQGSVNVEWGGGSAGDLNGKLSGSGATGTVNYATGFVDITVPAVAAGTPVTVSYSYFSSSTAGSAPGITSFTVQQSGQALSIVDSSGKIYTGTMSDSLTTLGGALSTANDGDTIVSSFSVSGQSASGANVTITGTFQATAKGTPASGQTAATTILINRQIIGTWVDDAGNTASINGIAN